MSKCLHNSGGVSRRVWLGCVLTKVRLHAGQSNITPSGYMRGRPATYTRRFESPSRSFRYARVTMWHNWRGHTCATVLRQAPRCMPTKAPCVWEECELDNSPKGRTSCSVDAQSVVHFSDGCPCGPSSSPAHRGNATCHTFPVSHNCAIHGSWSMSDCWSRRKCLPLHSCL